MFGKWFDKRAKNAANGEAWQRQRLSPGQIEARLSMIPPSLRPIRDALSALVGSGVWLEGETAGALVAGPRPDIAPQAFDIVVFEPLPTEALKTYQEQNNFSIPKEFLGLLCHMNGCHFFGINLYGVPPSKVMNPPLLDRSRRSPLDIASGRYWRTSYSGAELEDVLIGSRNVSDTGQVGYFMNSLGAISGRGNGNPGAPAECGRWTNITEWLSAEIA